MAAAKTSREVRLGGGGRFGEPGVREGGSEAREESGRLVRSGSISRGIVTGNRQDATMESGLQLRLEGPLTEEVSVEAVLSDRQTPIQPDGSTRKLRDLDEVFLRLNSPLGTATLGDFSFEMGAGTFARFDRKVQGASYRIGADSTEGGPGVSGAVAGAVTRGQYRRQAIEPVDGMQGPYQLRGARGEPFILVISGSEAVYLDGERLERGRSADYTIDYETGQISFTTDRLITADRRITVEFEYRTRRFTRTLAAGTGTARAWADEDGGSRLEIGARVVREADGSLFGRQAGLTAADSSLLRRAGDQPAIRSGAERVPFREEGAFVPYVRGDTTWNEGRRTIFAPAPVRRDSVYRVRFTRTGSDSAAYRRSDRSLNGVSYEWVGPGRGTYEPIEILPRPESRSLLDLTGRVRPAEHVEVFGEFARSIHDENRLSPRGGENDLGRALRGGIRLEEWELGSPDGGIGRLSGSLRHRRVDARFEPFQRIRPVEYGRRWNVAAEAGESALWGRGRRERTTQADLSWRWDDRVRVGGEWGRLRLGEAFEGYRTGLDVRLPGEGRTEGFYRLDWIRSREHEGPRGRWIRQNARVSRGLEAGSARPYLAFEHQRRRVREGRGSALVRPSESVLEWQPGLHWRLGSIGFEHSLARRSVQLPDGSALGSGPTSWTARSSARFDPDGRLSARGGLIYRHRSIPARLPDGRYHASGPTLGVELSGRWSDRSGGARVEGGYEAMTERTAILRETYLHAGSELGRYVWEDANGDGLTQVDEFLPEPTPMEGSYVRRFFPSDELVPVIRGATHLNLRLDGSRLVGEEPGWLGTVASELESETRVEVSEESTTDRLRTVYLMQLDRFQHPDRTVDGRIRWSERLEVFPDRARGGLLVRMQHGRSMHRRSTGIQQDLNRIVTVRPRVRLAEAWTGRVTARWSRDRSASPRFASRSFDLRSRMLAPELEVGAGTYWTARLRLGWTRKRDPGGGGERRTARIWRLPLHLEYDRPAGWRLQGRLEPAWVGASGPTSGLAGYELTDGRGPGRSLRWHLRARYALSDELDATLRYDGRLPAEAPAVHTVGLELRATF